MSPQTVIVILDPGLDLIEVDRVIAAIRQVKGVKGVDADTSGMTGQIAKARVKEALRDSLHTVLDKAKK